MAAAQASRTVEEVWAHSKVAQEDREMLKDESWRAGVRATCPSCNAPLAANAEFCPECGAKIHDTGHCTQCGALLATGAKFCGEWGAKTG
jgi:predicted amidophosphoribosyltransferase